MSALLKRGLPFTEVVPIEDMASSKGAPPAAAKQAPLGGEKHDETPADKPA